jgi:hypothetical protein
VTETLSGGQVVVLTLPPDRLFTSGMDVRIRPADGETPVPGSFTVAVYAAVDAPAEEGVVNIAGSLQERLPLGNTSSLALTIPFRGYQLPTPPAGTRVLDPVDPAIGPVGIQIVPASKGLSPEGARARFTVEITPRLRRIGALVVRIDSDEPATAREAREILVLTVDGNPIEPDTLVELTPGIYRLEAQAGDLLSYTANVGIDRAQVEEVVLSAEIPRAAIRINVPSVADVFWNGERVTDRSLSVEPGSHTVLIRLGDFSLSQQLELEPNGDYEVGMDLDILLKQN